MGIKIKVKPRVVSMTVNPGKITYLGGELYEGEHSVTPDTFAKTLKTAHKFVSQDITVEAVPYSEIVNISGGNTAVIGY